ncbi:hypothetical protein NCS52_00198400 [Fusarium sp. LHS14.1]|nr:hypothetical protein NCS52_00198400 [Fusarium sp. LHS14.1]
MRPSLLLPYLLGSVWASPTPSPIDVDPALIELGRRAAAAGQPTFNFTQCYVTVKGNPGFGDFQASTVQGNMYLVWGIPAPADNKNGDNPVDVVLRIGLGLSGGINFVTNGYLSNFPSVKAGPSLDYVKVTGTTANFQADVDFSMVPYGQQPQFMSVALRSSTSRTGWGPVTTYLIGSGFLGMKITEPTAQNTRDVNGAVYFVGASSSRYVASITGSCMGSSSLPLSIV